MHRKKQDANIKNIVNMEFHFKTQFNIGDRIWHKNLVTNESIEATIECFQVLHCVYKKKDSNELATTTMTIYHTDDGSPLCNIEGDLGSNSAYATKEECDAAPAYTNTRENMGIL